LGARATDGFLSCGPSARPAADQRRGAFALGEWGSVRGPAHGEFTRGQEDERVAPLELSACARRADEELRVLPVRLGVAMTSRLPWRAEWLLPGPGGGDEVGAAIGCCRAGERIEFREEFQFVPCSGAFGIPAGGVQTGVISSRDPAKWAGVAVFLGRLSLWQSCGENLYFFYAGKTRVAPNESADLGMDPTLTFSAGMRSGMSRGAAAGLVNEDTRPSR